MNDFRNLFAIGSLLIGCGPVFAQSESVLHVFQGQTAKDGYFPQFTQLVMDSAGNLYGTTGYGGGTSCNAGGNPGCGIVYQLVPPGQSGGSWTENVLYRFQGGTDGSYPVSLIAFNGKLWGDVPSGGTGSCAGGCGYLYQLKPPATPGGAWTKTVVFNFPNAGATCGISAVDSAGNFYGAYNNTAHPNGSICELKRPTAATAAWSYADLYDFKGVPSGQNVGDGSGPEGVTFDSHGNLWGVTDSGGYCQRFEGGSCFGTIFELTPPATAGGTWSETVQYRFNNLDQNPISGVALDSTGAVYGVTAANTYKFSGGAFQIIDSFPNHSAPDAYEPTGGVVLDSSGNVYGVTAAGGVSNDGTVYKLTPPNYTQTILHSFAGGTDGWNPEGPLTLGPGGVLFGTTQIGGNTGCPYIGARDGCGTVFQVTP